jgi:small-conductance mechanosensitive channel
MTEFFGVEIPMNPWVVLPLIFVAALILAYVVNYLIVRLFAGFFRKEGDGFDNRLYRLIERYLFPLLILGALLVIVNNVPLPPKIIRASHNVLVFISLLIAIFFLSRTVLMILRNAEGRYEPLRNIRGPIEILVKIVFVAVGGMIILDNLGVSLTPIITTLGIGSLAVAIALQDTLGNFFAGLYIKADRFIDVGQYVRLESGGEGYVKHIGWRSTQIQMLSNSMIIVPNNKLVQSIITNHYLPDPEIAVVIDLGVHYDSDMEKVERVTSEVAQDVLRTVPGGVASFQPFIRYHTFAESSINFSVILRARQFTDNFLLKHEFIKKLQARYKAEGITIPFPIRTVYTKPVSSEKTEKEEADPGAD